MKYQWKKQNRTLVQAAGRTVRENGVRGKQKSLFQTAYNKRAVDLINRVTWAVEGTFQTPFREWRGRPCLRRLQVE